MAIQALSAKEGGMALPCDISPQNDTHSRFRFIFHNVLLFEPFLSTVQKVIFFCQAANISSCGLSLFASWIITDPMQKMMSLVIHVYKFGQEISLQLAFFENFVQIPKNNFSQICMKCIFATWKKT